jgi:hypothetical protein
MRRKREIEITPEIRAELQMHRERTKIGPTKLLYYRETHPKGLTPAMVSSWLQGEVKSTTHERLLYVLNKWESLPSCDFEYIEITSDILEQLISYKDKTTIGPKILLSKLENIPAGLNAALINNWLSKGVRSAREDHLAFVLNNWKQLSLEPERIKITPDILQKLKDYRDAFLLPGNILKNATDKPEGLTSHIISSWFSGRTKTARKDHIEYVLSRCQNFKNI